MAGPAARQSNAGATYQLARETETQVSFENMGLAEPILKGIRTAGYEQATEIQLAVIPTALRGGDLIALAETGSGKTAAFGLPILNGLLDGPPGLRALILVPTRELCVQVAENLRNYAAGTDLCVRTAFGGIDLSIQEAAFKRGVDVVVACPGRMIDHLERGNLDLKALQTVVLDEADRMLDMGFLPQIRSILVRCPHERTTWLFSATMPPEVDELCDAFLPNTERLQIGRRGKSPKTISHRFVGVKPADKERYLVEMLRRETGRVLIFVKTKIKTDQLGRKLARTGLPADSIHGDKSAEARYTVLRSFDRGKTKFLVATDVAARGIDVDNIELVVNFDMPNEVEDYVHRTGRTGRAGARGRAVSLVGPTDRGIHRSIVAHLNDSPQNGEGGNAPREKRDRPRGGRRPGRGQKGRSGGARGGVIGHGGRRR